MPDLAAPDQAGRTQTLKSIMEPEDAMLVFCRSADRWPFCKARLVELARVERIRKDGLGLVAIRYDSPAI